MSVSVQPVLSMEFSILVVYNAMSLFGSNFGILEPNDFWDFPSPFEIVLKFTKDGENTYCRREDMRKITLPSLN